MLVIRRGQVLAGLLLVAGCGSSSSGSQSPSLYQTWESINAAGTAGISVAFSSAGTYEQSKLTLTSANSGDAEVEIGTFTISGQTITFTPEQWTCTGPDPVYSASYALSGSSLVISVGGVVDSFDVDTTPAGQFQLTEGCFSTTGAFTAEALAPVSQ